MRYGGHTSCVDVELADGTRVILDAGTGLRALGQHWPAAGTGRTAIPLVLTHRHSDHVMGLAHFAPLINRTHDVRIACAGVDRDALRVFVDQQLSAPLFPTLAGVTEAVTIAAFDAEGVLPIGADCRVRALPARHPGGAAVVVVDDARGPVVAFAPDNELSMANDSPDVAAWRASLGASLRGVPVLLHDATYTDAELPAHDGWGHSSAEEATRFAMLCGVGILLLTHHHPDRSDSEVDAMLACCRGMVAAAGSALRILAATEGEVVEVL